MSNVGGVIKIESRPAAQKPRISTSMASLLPRVTRI
jgi:hypothetical protein